MTPNTLIVDPSDDLATALATVRVGGPSSSADEVQIAGWNLCAYGHGSERMVDAVERVQPREGLLCATLGNGHLRVYGRLGEQRCAPRTLPLVVIRAMLILGDLP